MESKECRIVVTWLKWQVRQNNAHLFVRQKSGNSDLNYSWLAVVLRGISISIWVYARLSAEFFWQRVGICTQRVGILLFRRKREEERDFYLHWNIWLMLNTFESEFFFHYFVVGSLEIRFVCYSFHYLLKMIYVFIIIKLMISI